MKTVARYNVYKLISTVLTMGTPIISLASCSELFIHRSDTSISAAGVFAILISFLFFKDKMLEKFKAPSPLVISIVGLILIHLIESIIYPIKIVFWVTVITTGVDAVTFRRMYKDIEKTLGDITKDYLKFGFLFTTTDNLIGGDDEQN